MNTVHLNIDLNFQQLVNIVKQLSPSDKLKLNDIIWDESIEIPIEQKQLVMSRMQKSKENPDRLLDWEESSKTLKT
jgi:hypothetical protein